VPGSGIRDEALLASSVGASHKPREVEATFGRVVKQSAIGAKLPISNNASYALLRYCASGGWFGIGLRELDPPVATALRAVSPELQL
jgi:hypothetical protein